LLNFVIIVTIVRMAEKKEFVTRQKEVWCLNTTTFTISELKGLFPLYEGDKNPNETTIVVEDLGRKQFLEAILLGEQGEQIGYFVSLKNRPLQNSMAEASMIREHSDTPLDRTVLVIQISEAEKKRFIKEEGFDPKTVKAIAKEEKPHFTNYSLVIDQ
jgi:hypothetical protein